MYLSKKVRLRLTEEQIYGLHQALRMTYVVYNEALTLIKKHIDVFGNPPDSLSLIKQFRRESKENKYANRFSDYLVNRAIKDALDYYIHTYFTRGNDIRYKSLNSRKLFFKLGQPKLLEVRKNGIFIGGLANKEQKSEENFFQISEKGAIPYNKKLCDMEILYDHTAFYFIFSFETTQRDLLISKTHGVGIDVGIKALATLSDGRVYENIFKSKRFQDTLSRKHKIQSEITKLRSSNTVEGGEQERSCKLQKLELKYQKLNDYLCNARRDYLHKVSSEIVKRNPAFIAVESLDIRSMIGVDKSLTTRLQATAIKMFLDMLEYKAKLYKIPFIKVEQNFPSSKKCCNCGHISSSLTLNDRTYVCDCCGFSIDRDLNAAVNIYKRALCLYREKRLGINAPLNSYYCKKYRSWRKHIARYIIKDDM